MPHPDEGVPIETVTKRKYLTSFSNEESVYFLDQMSGADTFNTVLFTDSLFNALKWAVERGQNVYKDFEMYWRNPWAQ